MKTLSASIALSVFVSSCGGEDVTAPADNCSSFAGIYNVTTEIVGTDCPVGLHAVTQPITWTFVQTAPSCRFTMMNSLYPTTHYSGYFTMEGAQARVTWTSVSPAPVVAAHALTYTSESLTISPAATPAVGTISGSFAWNTAYPCTGTTNVCHGSVASGCPTPN